MTLQEAYLLFDVPSACTYVNLRQKYLHYMLQHHPDRGGDPFMYRLLQHAYQLIRSSRRDLRDPLSVENADEKKLYTRWSTVLQEYTARRQETAHEPVDDTKDDTKGDTKDARFFTSDEFNHHFEKRYHAPLVFAQDAVELREARHLILTDSDANVSGRSRQVGDYILTAWKDQMDHAIQPTYEYHNQELNQGNCTRIQHNSSCQISCTDIVEAYRPSLLPDTTTATDPPLTSPSAPLLSPSELLQKRNDEVTEWIQSNTRPDVDEHLKKPETVDQDQFDFETLLSGINHLLCHTPSSIPSASTT